ncbi:MAG TPA: GtrA family protein [Chloroflexi bacterium]|nr:GtrA family protein [Chloroflexota bacterium]
MTQIVARILAFRREHPAELGRFLRFAVVGTIGAVVDFSVLNMGILLFGLEKWLANTVSFTVAVCSNFTWNRFWTYPESRSEPPWRQLGQFFLVNLVGYGINQAVFLSLDRRVFATWGAWGYNVSKAIAIGVVLFWNFGINRIWTYRAIR